MNEIEVKVLGVDIDKLREEIINQGGFIVKKENQENYIYNLPQSIAGENGYVRIRRIHNLIDCSKKDMLCIKKIVSQGKYRVTEEHEFEVSDFNESSLFLQSLGVEFSVRQDKYRESYSFNGVLIEIDIWNKEIFPYPYVEIESINEDLIFETMDLLKIPREKATSKSLAQIKEELGLK